MTNYVSKKTTTSVSGTNTQYQKNVSSYFANANAYIIKVVLAGGANALYPSLITINKYDAKYYISVLWKDAHIQSIAIDNSGVLTVSATSTCYGCTLSLADVAGWITT